VKSFAEGPASSLSAATAAGYPCVERYLNTLRAALVRNPLSLRGRGSALGPEADEAFPPTTLDRR
jgi:hypothetical protein